MRRKSVRDLLQSLAQLRATVEAERARLARDLGRRLAAPPGAAPAYRAVFEHLEAELLALESQLAAAEDAYAAEKPRPGKLRERRNRTAAQLHALHGPLRRLLATFPCIESAGLTTQTPRDPQLLVAQASETLHLLRRFERDPPPPSRGVIMDPAAVAAELEVGCRRLKTVLADLEVAQARTRAAREEAQSAIARTEEVGPWVTRTLEGLAGLARVGAVGPVTHRRRV